MYLRKVREREKEVGKGPEGQEVFVLDGGFVEWQEK